MKPPLSFSIDRPGTAAMAYEEIAQPIDVITFFQNGKLHPLRFKWQGKVYKIKQVNNSWSMQAGMGRRHHFSVSTDSPDCYELIFDSADFRWQLSKVYLEG